MRLEAYKVKTKIKGRTLTIELPEEFENADDKVQSKEEKIAIIQKFRGFAKPPFYAPTEDEWYKQ